MGWDIGSEFSRTDVIMIFGVILFFVGFYLLVLAEWESCLEMFFGGMIGLILMIFGIMVIVGSFVLH